MTGYNAKYLHTKHHEHFFNGISWWDNVVYLCANSLTSDEPEIWPGDQNTYRHHLIQANFIESTIDSCIYNAVNMMAMPFCLPIRTII